MPVPTSINVSACMCLWLMAGTGLFPKTFCRQRTQGKVRTSTSEVERLASLRHARVSRRGRSHVCRGRGGSHVRLVRGGSTCRVCVAQPRRQRPRSGRVRRKLLLARESDASPMFFTSGGGDKDECIWNLFTHEARSPPGDSRVSGVPGW